MSGTVSKIDQLLKSLGEEAGTSASTSSSNEKYVLDYFPIGGRAGPIRMAFFLQNIEYEDLFIGYEQLKQLKEENKTAWLGSPNLSIYNKGSDELVTRIGQSNTILRYVARLGETKGNGVELYPTSDALISARIDEICDACEDVYNSFGPTMRIKDEKEKEAKRIELWGTRWSVLFDKFDGKLALNATKCNSGLFVGDSLTIADLKFYVVIKHWISGLIDYVDKDFINDARYKNLKTFVDKMDGMEQIQAFEADFQKRAKEWKDSQAK